MALATLRQDGTALQYVSSELQKDKEMVMTSPRIHTNLIDYIYDDIRADRDVVLAYVARCGGWRKLSYGPFHTPYS